MRLLIDTHAALWWFENAPVLTKQALSVLADESTDVVYSPASVYEITYKGALRKIPPPELPFAESAARQGFEELPIIAAHAAVAANLSARHKDPWDRIIAAQAIIEGRTVLTRDPKIAALGAPCLW